MDPTEATNRHQSNMESIKIEMEQLARFAETQQRQLELLEGQVVWRERRRTTQLSPYVDGEDIENFLLTFERAMQLHDILGEEWPEHLLGVLTGKARAAFAEVNTEADYGTIKEAVLARFEVTPEASRIKFRGQKYDPRADPCK